ncbi:MAG: amidase family protein, partial [Qingshengfaniella sp.]
AHAGRMAQLFGRVDCLLIPALPIAGPSLARMGAFASDDEATQVIGRYTVPFDMCGLPTLTQPNGRSPAGIPLAHQLAGPRLSEPLLCRVGAAFEDATDWRPAPETL